MPTYEEFLERKTKHVANDGFDPLWMPDFLYGFQSSLTGWAIRKGRAAIFADCGLGKTPMQLVWAQNVFMHSDKPVLILTPLAVAQQTLQQASKFGIEAQRSRDGSVTGPIVVANYERLHYFDPSDFGGIVCDESSILKNCDGATRQRVTEFNKRLPYRLLCTATAAPNDHMELGTSSEALGYLGYRDMMTMYFKEVLLDLGPGWMRHKVYRLRGHARQAFWQWVCSWARACRKPSDLGFDDDGFILPPLNEIETVIQNTTPREGMLFSVPAVGLSEQREERRVTISERCERVAEIVSAHDGASVSWCHLNAEGDALEKRIPDSKQVSGSMPDEEKEETLAAFQSGEIKRLITKPKIGCFGLNWQHCNLITTFTSHSWEQYYQLVRRCWRFGQTQPVTVHIIATEGEQGVTANLIRKAKQTDEMFDSLVANMANELKTEAAAYGTKKETIPSWLSSTNA